MAQSLPEHAFPQHCGATVLADFFNHTRTAAALLALSDETLAKIGVDRAQIRNLARRLVD